MAWTDISKKAQNRVRWRSVVDACPMFRMELIIRTY